jgi:pimeloyl-ACP methyl ester carboxylesterase
MNDTEKTSASFIPDAIQGKKLYRTGDWGRFWPTGWIEFLGRQDLQIKVGGFRIEIGEIEAALLNHKDVAEAVVVDKELTDKKKYLVAFYTVKNKKHCSSETVRKKLEESLPHYMIPAAFIQLEHLPKNINGKIDRKALRNTNHSLSPNPTSHSNRKLTKMEHIVAEQWEKALGQKVGSPEDDFFALGGDSINALHVILGLENDLAKSIDIRLLYENPLLNEFSLALMNSAEDDKDSFTRLNRSSSHETLYCIHPIGGGVLGYKEVAKHLEKDFSVLGLAMSYKSRYPECPLEELTQHYIKRILETNPKQPVKLLGWSMGGLISYELARQLNSLGISTKLILIDTWVSKGSSAMRQTPRKILEGFVYDLYEGAIPKEPNDILRNEDVHTIGKFVEYANRMNFNLPIPPRHIEQLFGIYEANLHRIINYPYPGHISNMLFLDATQRNQVFSAFLTPMTDSKQWKNAFIDNSLEKYEKNHYSICKDLDDGKLVSQVTKWLS